MTMELKYQLVDRSDGDVIATFDGAFALRVTSDSQIVFPAVLAMLNAIPNTNPEDIEDVAFCNAGGRVYRTASTGDLVIQKLMNGIVVEACCMSVGEELLWSRWRDALRDD